MIGLPHGVGSAIKPSDKRNPFGLAVIKQHIYHIGTGFADTDNLAKADIAGSVENLKATIAGLNAVVAKLNSQDGSLGKLMNDKTLYNNLTNTVRSANILLDDLRVHPKRYVNVSVFGRKDKSIPLTAPLTDSSIQK